MATIGPSIGSETGEISGSVKTLTLNVKSVKFVFAEGDTKKARTTACSRQPSIMQRAGFAECWPLKIGFVRGCGGYCSA